MDGREHLLRRGADPEVVGEIDPANDAGGVHEKLGGPGNVLSVLTRTRVQDVVAANDLRAVIGKKRVGVPSFAAKVCRLSRRINTDGDRPDPGAFKVLKVLLDTP